MSASNHDAPTDDPVERERALMDQELPVGSAQDLDSSGEQTGARWTFLSKLAVALCITLIAGYLLLWARSVQGNGGPDLYVRVTDFMTVLTGATIIQEGNGQQLYDLQTQQEAQFRVRGPLANPGDNLLPYNHLPFEALAVVPFIGLPFPFIFALWTMVAGLSIGMSLGLMDGALPGARPLGWVMSLAACSYLPLIRGLMLGQNSAFVLLGLCATFVAVKRGQPVWAGAALLLVALKPQILPLVLLLMLFQREWKALGVFVGLMALLSLLAMAALGPGWPFQYLNLLVGVAEWSHAGAIDPTIMHNWRGLASNLFGTNSPLTGLLYLLLSLASVALVVWALWRFSAPRERVENQADAPRRVGRWDLLWALTGIVALLISPHLNPHDLTLLIFPAWILGTYAATGPGGRRASWAWMLVLWAGYAILPLAFAAQGATVGNSIVVIPSVLLMAGAALLLVRQMGRAESRSYSSLATVT